MNKAISALEVRHPIVEADDRLDSLIDADDGQEVIDAEEGEEGLGVEDGGDLLTLEDGH